MKNVKGIVITLLIVILGIVTMPFSVVHADSHSIDYDDAIEGVFYSNGSQSPVQITWVFNQPVIGYFEPQIKYKTSSSSAVASKTPTIYVNGTTAQFLMTTIDEQAILIQSVTNTFDMLDTIDDYVQYYFPYESLNFIVETAGRGYNQVDLYNLGKWTIPVFEVPANGEITHKYLYADGDNSTMTIVLWINKAASSISSFANYFDITNGELVELIPLNVFAYNGTNGTRLIKVVIKNNTTSTANVYLYAKTKCLIMPIYAHSNREMGYETKDFCDNFGLPYNGLTTEQEQSADDLTNDSADMQDSFDDMFTIENQYNQDLNNQIDNIDFTNPLSGNQSLLSSGNFVIQVFNGLIANNPISLLIIIACILLVARRLFG